MKKRLDRLLEQSLDLFHCIDKAIEAKMELGFFPGVTGSYRSDEPLEDLVKVRSSDGEVAGQLLHLIYWDIQIPIVIVNEKKMVAAHVSIGTWEAVNAENIALLQPIAFKMASKGLLGNDMTDYGAQMLRIYTTFKGEWGEKALAAWTAGMPSLSHNAKIRAAVKALLNSGVTNPKSVSAARAKGAKFGFLLDSEWRSVVSLTKAMVSTGLL